MQRVMCVWLPEWPLQRIRIVQPEHKHRPTVLYAEASRKGHRIVACCQAALRCGITPGMPLAEAQGLTGTSRTQQAEPLFCEHNPEEDRAALNRLAGWCQRYSPAVGTEGEDCLLLDVTGCAHLWGGEQQLSREFHRAVGQWGLTAGTACADTIGAAWAIARSGESRETVVPPGQQAAVLRSLPVRALRLPAAAAGKLEELAIRRIAQLQQLPRASLSSRFGPEVARRLDQALGALPEQIEPVRLAEPVEVSLEFEYSTGDRGALEAALTQLVEQAVGQLSTSRQGVQQLEICLVHAEQQNTQLTVGTLRPSPSEAHLMELVRTRLERTELTEEVAGLHVTITAAAPLESRQHQLFDTVEHSHTDQEFARLIDRLSSRLGRQQVVRTELIPDAQPEFAVRWVPALDSHTAHRPSRQNRPTQQIQQPPFALPITGPVTWPAAARPLRLPAEPEPVGVTSLMPDGPPIRFRYGDRMQTVGRWWGPERIETGWWRERPIRRDYYRVETHSGQRFWLFRHVTQGSWFLHGEFE
ncbi:MAG: DNA polymerase Y family protein [Planctomycetaceae bacterium]|nr:DNA polymerase Y family protein [Planctomycetaceae bacterium]